MLKLLATYLLCFVCFGAIAQSKIGYVNLSEVTDSMPETKAMYVLLNAKTDSIVKVHDAFQKSFYSKMSAFHSKITQQELDSLQGILLGFPAKYQHYIDSLQTILYLPIQKRIANAVKEIAKENGYNYVLDSSNGAAYALKEGEDDLTQLVLQRLGIK
jgi:outer membrane protein